MLGLPGVIIGKVTIYFWAEGLDSNAPRTRAPVLPVDFAPEQCRCPKLRFTRARAHRQSRQDFGEARITYPQCGEVNHNLLFRRCEKFATGQATDVAKSLAWSSNSAVPMA